jgi:DNA invertase Pin-like site-specific DNA recombinase
MRPVWQGVNRLQGDKPGCVLYCRVAHKDPADPDCAIEQQRRLVEDYARSMGYAVTEVYADNGYSAHDTERPAFAKLNADIAAGRVQTVLTKDPSRIARDVVSGSDWFGRMDKRGVTVLCKEAPGFQRAMVDGPAEFVLPGKRKKRKQARHTVRTPPPPSKSNAR